MGLYSFPLFAGAGTPTPVAPGTPTAAYGTTKLVTGYAGSCLRVRRSSDNTEQDIGFSGVNLDTASLLSFVGVNNGFVRTLYDQSGNARDFVQTTQADQPQIVASGALVSGLNAHALLDFDGTSDHLTCSATLADLLSASAGTVFAVYLPDTINGTFAAPYLDEAIWCETGGFAGLHLYNIASQGLAYNWDGNADTAAGTITAGQGTVQVWCHRSGNIECYTRSSTPATAASGDTTTLTGTMRVGRNFGSVYYDGKLAALVFYNTALASSTLTTFGRDLAQAHGMAWGA